MIRCIKLGAIFAVWTGFFAVLLLCYGWTALFRLAHRWRIISRISRSFLLFLRKALRIRVEVHGDCGRLQAGGCVIIANHVSYVDGIVLGSIFPVVLVTKAEVREWPVIGQWAALCGTVFVERGRRHSIGELVAAIRAKLKDGANILLFPEGTASDGERLLPFQTAVLAAPLRSRSAIVPVTITYERIDTRPVSAANRDRIYCYGLWLSCRTSGAYLEPVG